MKKIISVFAAALFVFSTVLSVSARCHGSASKRNVRYDCGFSNCGSCYCGEHDYHEYCTLKNCEEIGCHEHEGAYYFTRAVDSGLHSFTYCAVEGCELIGCHEHDGTYYYAANTSNSRYSQKSGGRHHR